jgi:hypothetical protein
MMKETTVTAGTAKVSISAIPATMISVTNVGRKNAQNVQVFFVMNVNINMLVSDRNLYFK